MTSNNNNQLALIPAKALVQQQRTPRKSSVTPSKKTVKKEVQAEVKRLANETTLSLKPTRKAYDDVNYAKRLYDIKTNQYLLTLFNPFDNRGVRIPDLVAYPSSTFTVEWQTTLVPGLVGGKYQNQAFIYPQLFSSIYTSSTANYAMNGSQSSPNSSQISATYITLRPVSMGVTLKWAGAPMTARGEIATALVPWGYGFPSTWANLLAMRGAKVYPILDGCTAVWVPMDPSSHMYRQSTIIAYNTTTGLWTSDNINQVPCMGCPGIFVAMNDVDSTGYIEMNIVMNFEAIPAYSTWLPTSTQTSPVNLNDLAVAHTVAANAPTSKKGISPKALLNDALSLGKSFLKTAVSQNVPILGGALASLIG